MRFSVIIPLYNKSIYIQKAIISVLNQSYLDFELIVVDDGSIDDSVAKVEALISENSSYKIKLIKQNNSGVSSARNHAAEEANGEYLCFLDADDWWEKDYLKSVNNLIVKFPDAGIYATNYFYVKNEQKSIRLSIPTGYVSYFKEYGRSLVAPVWTGAVTVSRILFQQYGGFKTYLKLGEDFDLWTRIAENHKIVFCSEPLSNYNQDVETATRLTRNLQKPQYHMLWNLQDFSELEKNDKDFKYLIDRLRIHSLLPYYLSDKYRVVAIEELKKVDWNNHSRKDYLQYCLPIFIVKFKYSFMKFGSKVKQYIISKIK